MAKQQRHDWTRIKLAFIKSTLTVEEFGEKHGIPLGTLKRKVTKDGWLGERSAANEKLIRKSLERTADKKAETLSEFDDDCVKIAKRINSTLVQMLGGVENPQGLKAIASTLKDTQAVTRLALGASTENKAIENGFDRDEWIRKLSEIDNGL